jgi:pSer/pThr/pTyr-binding forkhead associated (FHA) protein
MTPENKRLNPIEKDVVGIIKIGRTVAGAQADDNCVTFRTKVVSRQHAEIWAINGDVYIRDVGSQTGTFLNAMRLSETGKDSKPYRLRSGDTVQFGVDFNKTDDGIIYVFM